MDKHARKGAVAVDELARPDHSAAARQPADMIRSSHRGVQAGGVLPWPTGTVLLPALKAYSCRRRIEKHNANLCSRPYNPHYSRTIPPRDPYS